MCKKINYRIIFLLFFVIFFGIYLNRAYARIYDYIGRENLAAIMKPVSYPIIIKSNHKSNKLPMRLVTLGDSLTVGVGASNMEKSFTYLFAQRIANNKYFDVEYYNFGVSGERSEGVLMRQVDQAISLQPDIITLSVGVNDIHGFVNLSLFRQNLVTILDRLKKETNAQVVIMTAPYLGSKKNMMWPYHWFFNYQTKRYNQVIISVAKQKGIIISDIYTNTFSVFYNDSTVYASDGFHPSDSGYKLWSDILYADFNY